METRNFIEDAKAFVQSYIERELNAMGKQMIYPIIKVKLDHDPKGEWDGIHNAVLVSRDLETGFVHLYIMTCIMHKSTIEKMFNIKIDNYVGHIVIDSEEMSKKYLKIVKKFSLDYILKYKQEEAERKKKIFSEWDNIV